MRRATNALRRRSRSEWVEPVRHVTGECTLWPNQVRHGKWFYQVEDWEQHDRDRVLSRDF